MFMRTTRPLGILPEVTLTDEELRGLMILQCFDLQRIRERLTREGAMAMPEAWIDDAIMEFRRYLGLYAVTNGPLPMLSRHVDKVWHTCLLFSQLYADLCEQSFGTFVHHEPHVEDDVDVHVGAVQATLRIDLWSIT
jgi:hypothetical protein